MALTDYANRKYDFLALQNIRPINKTQLGLELAAPKSSGQIATGPQKLAQRWLLEFLTELGSMTGLPERGTNFMTLVRQGRLRTEAAILAAFNFAAYDARVNLIKEEDDTWADDERIASATLQSIAFLPGYAQIRFILSSRAGDSRAIILPVDTLPKNLT
jgi:hypothetical protein